MSVGNAPFQSPHDDVVLDDPTEKWAMPLGRIAGTRISLSYTVFVAAAILVPVVWSVASRPGNLPSAVGLGVAFWVSAWLVQAGTQFGLTRLLGLSLPHLNVGLIGVEAPPRPWTASRCLIVAMGTASSLLVLACFYRLVGGGFQMPVLSRSAGAPWAAPSIGFSTYDSVWRSAAWLCWVQALFQMFPLPRTLGRQIIGALAGLCASRLDVALRVTVFRRCLAAIAMVTIATSMYGLSIEGDSLIATRWPLILLLGLLLWASSRGSDVVAILVGHDQGRISGAASVSGATGHSGPVSRFRSAIRARLDDRKLKKALDRERGEAADAARLDDVLNRLHRNGIDSLSEDDRMLLERVSENLRKQRAVQSDSLDEPS